MNKYERAKLWAKKHQEALFMVGVSTVVIGLVIAGVKADSRYRERVSIEFNGYIDELNEWYRTKDLVEIDVS